MRTRTLIPAVFVVSLALAACSSPAVENSGVDAPPTTPAADDFSDVSSYYPVGEGNTWQYEMVMPDPIGTVVETETMTEVVRDGDAVRATIERTFHYESGFAEDVTDSVDYLFYDDGSLEVPYQSLPDSSGAVVTVKEGTMVWPSDEEFEAGTKKTGTIKASVETSGQTIDQVIDFVIAGGGTETVKVPAGEFDARLLKQTLTISIPDFGVDGLTMKASSWLAPGTGLVRTEIPNILGEGSISMELVKFTPGE